MERICKGSSLKTGPHKARAAIELEVRSTFGDAEKRQNGDISLDPRRKFVNHFGGEESRAEKILTQKVSR